MNILICAIHWAVASGRYCADALVRMGHDVRTDGPDQGTSLWGLTMAEDYIWTPQPPEKRWKPDLVIIMDAHLPAEAAQGHACPVVVYGVDNHVRDYAQYTVDHLFLAHGHGLRMGEDNVTWLPCGYDPEHFTPGPKWEDRPYDAAMMAVPYGPRQELTYMLQGIPGLRMLYGFGGIYDKFAHAYQHSKMSVVRSAAQDVAQRVWETAAMGCLVVMDWCPDCEALGLEHEKNCLIYHSHFEAVTLVRWALAHPDQAAKIARAGQKWAKPGTWDARLEVILDWFKKHGKGKKPPTPPEPKVVYPDPDYVLEAEYVEEVATPDKILEEAVR